MKKIGRFFYFFWAYLRGIITWGEFKRLMEKEFEPREFQLKAHKDIHQMPGFKRFFYLLYACYKGVIIGDEKGLTWDEFKMLMRKEFFSKQNGNV